MAIDYMWCTLSSFPSVMCFCLVPVSVTEVEAVREGHQSEILLSTAEEFPADLCFTLVFHGRQGNLDLVAESSEEAQAWIQGVRKLIHKAQTMDEQERLDQYPHSVRDSSKTAVFILRLPNRTSSFST